MDADLLLWVNSEKSTDEMVPTYKNLDVSKQGRDVFIGEDEKDPLYIASSFVTVLSLPFYLDQVVPRLVAAVDGDPSTTTD